MSMPEEHTALDEPTDEGLRETAFTAEWRRCWRATRPSGIGGRPETAATGRGRATASRWRGTGTEWAELAREGTAPESTGDLRNFVIELSVGGRAGGRRAELRALQGFPDRPRPARPASSAPARGGCRCRVLGLPGGRTPPGPVLVGRGGPRSLTICPGRADPQGPGAEDVRFQDLAMRHLDAACRSRSS